MPHSPDSPSSELLEVGVLAPAEGTFTYRISSALAPLALPGSRVLVPFGKRRLTGIALGPVKNGAADPSSRLALRDGLTRVHGYPGVSGVTTVLPDGNTSKRPFMLGVRRGEIVSLD